MSSITKFGFGAGEQNASPERWGGKGAGLLQMSADGLNVPAGFIITTEACGVYEKHPEALMDAIMSEVGEYLSWLNTGFGYMPLLSVRSGARVSMPGMMDTILNVGICPSTLSEWGGRLNEDAAYDCYRRLMMMLGETALGYDKKDFEITDMGLDMEGVCKQYEKIFLKAKQFDIIDDPMKQLRTAIEAVFKSWQSPRAIEYRKLENIPAEWGTAVTVQAMVFGNMNDKSGSGVLFSRNPSTGEKGLYGEFLMNAQGEDVVAGTHTPMPVQDMQKNDLWLGIYNELVEIADTLETSRKDMQDMEFTVQDGKVYMLQTRNGKRSAQAAFKIAMDMMDEGLIDMPTALSRIQPKQFKVVKRPQIDPAFTDVPLMYGIAGSMGVVTGQVALSSQDAVAKASTGMKVILVTEETTPDDIAGMAASVGILTKTGGATSHAAVVARGMDKPCVVGCTELQLEGGEPTFNEGDIISIDGATGRVWNTAIPLIDAMADGAVSDFLDSMLSFKNVIEQSSTPKRFCVVPLADWLGLTDAEITEHMKTAAEILTSNEWIMFDASFKASAEDNMIWGIAGGSPEKDRMKQIVELVAQHNLERAYASGDDELVKMLLKAGATDVPTVDTIAELRQATGMVRIGWQALQIIGSPDDQEALFSILREAGAMSAKIMSAPMTKNYAAFTLLGKAA